MDKHSSKDSFKQMLNDSSSQMSNKKIKTYPHIDYQNITQYKWNLDPNISNMIDNGKHHPSIQSRRNFKIKKKNSIC